MLWNKWYDGISRALAEIKEKGPSTVEYGEEANDNIVIRNASVIEICYNKYQIVSCENDERMNIIFVKNNPDEFIYILDKDTSIVLSPEKIDTIGIFYDPCKLNHIVMDFQKDYVDIGYYKDNCDEWQDADACCRKYPPKYRGYYENKID